MRPIQGHPFLNQVLTVDVLLLLLLPAPALAQPPAAADDSPRPVMAIHVSELTRALEALPTYGSAAPKTPDPSDAFTGLGYTHAWHYFVLCESLMEALVNLYGHNSSAYGLMNVYMPYSLAKPRMWAANSVEIADWWALRSKVTVIPVYQASGAQVIVTATVSGASDPDTAIELVIPHWNPAVTGRLQVFVNSAPAPGDRYRFTSYGIKIKVGSDVSAVEVRFTARTDLRQDEWRNVHAK